MKGLNARIKVHIKPTKDGGGSIQIFFCKIDWLHVDWLIGYGTQLQNKENGDTWTWLESNNYNKYYGWVTHWYILNHVNGRKYWYDVINRKMRNNYKS